MAYCLLSEIASIRLSECLLLQGVGNGGVKDYVESQGLAQISDTTQIGEMLDSIIQAHPKELEQFRSGKTKIQGYFSGYVSLLFRLILATVQNLVRILCNLLYETDNSPVAGNEFKGAPLCV